MKRSDVGSLMYCAAVSIGWIFTLAVIVGGFALAFPDLIWLGLR